MSRSDDAAAVVSPAVDLLCCAMAAVLVLALLMAARHKVRAAAAAAPIAAPTVAPLPPAVSPPPAEAPAEPAAPTWPAALFTGKTAGAGAGSYAATICLRFTSLNAGSVFRAGAEAERIRLAVTPVTPSGGGEDVGRVVPLAVGVADVRQEGKTVVVEYTCVCVGEGEVRVAVRPPDPEGLKTSLGALFMLGKASLTIGPRNDPQPASFDVNGWPEVRLRLGPDGVEVPKPPDGGGNDR